jgi:hypothetical protein
LTKLHLNAQSLNQRRWSDSHGETRIMPRHKRTREWLIIVAVVVALHAVLFLTVRPSFFAMFKKTTTADSAGQKAEPFASTSVLIIPIEIEDESNEAEQDPVQEAPEQVVREVKEKREQSLAAKHEVPENDQARDSDAPIDVESVLGESPETLPNNTGPKRIVIPPRALEITWPDTRKLRHCLGHHIDLKILVDDQGKIVSVEPLDTGHPNDCIQAAVESASRIVFEPGRVDGAPAEMWTQVRIDFRKKR